MRTTYLPSAHGVQKRATDLGVAVTCELPCGFWELNPGSLQEQHALNPTELSQVLVGFLKIAISLLNLM